MKNILTLLILSLYVNAEAKVPAKTKTPQRKPNQYEEIQKIKIHVRVGEAQSRFEINASATHTVTVFHSQFGRTHTLRSPLRDFADLKNVFLAPGTNANSCNGSTIVTESFTTRSTPNATITDCYNGTSGSSKSKTQAVQTLSQLASM